MTGRTEVVIEIPWLVVIPVKLLPLTSAVKRPFS